MYVMLLYSSGQNVICKIYSYPMASGEELSENSDNCAICWEKMESARKLPCTHLFHKYVYFCYIIAENKWSKTGWLGEQTAKQHEEYSHQCGSQIEWELKHKKTNIFFAVCTMGTWLQGKNIYFVCIAKQLFIIQLSLIKFYL